LNTAKALLTRKNFPETFISYFSSGLNGIIHRISVHFKVLFLYSYKYVFYFKNNLEENDDHHLWSEAISNNKWTIEADQQIIQWFNTAPHDWQPYTKCDAYLWGNGRNGQLGDTGILCNNF